MVYALQQGYRFLFVRKWMTSLELKIPPVFVLGFFAALTALARYYDVLLFRTNKVFDLWAAVPLGIGIAIALLGVIEFKKAQTTVDPIHPEKVSNLVVGGIFRFTRNPMYVGMILGLVGLTSYMGTWFGMVSAALCAGYLTRFQIIPEERAIEALFGDEYRQYKSKVRPWL
jgi:protein-S-isoprenylcysteine O-methyltransferase Ste14